MSASVFKRGSRWPWPCMSWLSLSARLLFSTCTMTGSGRWLFITNSGLKTTWRNWPEAEVRQRASVESLDDCALTFHWAETTNPGKSALETQLQLH